MKTQNQKHDERFSKRAARWWSNVKIKLYNRIATWWINFTEWAEDVDFGELCANIFFVLLIAGGFFGFIYLGVYKSHKDKATNSDVDTVTVVEEQYATVKKQNKIDWDVDTTVVLPPIEKSYRLHFKGKAPYFILVESLDTIQ